MTLELVTATSVAGTAAVAAAAQEYGAPRLARAASIICLWLATALVCLLLVD